MQLSEPRIYFSFLPEQKLQIFFAYTTNSAVVQGREAVQTKGCGQIEFAGWRSSNERLKQQEKTDNSKKHKKQTVTLA